MELFPISLKQFSPIILFQYTMFGSMYCSAPCTENVRAVIQCCCTVKAAYTFHWSWNYTAPSIWDRILLTAFYSTQLCPRACHIRWAITPGVIARLGECAVPWLALPACRPAGGACAVAAGQWLRRAQYCTVDQGISVQSVNMYMRRSPICSPHLYNEFSFLQQPSKMMLNHDRIFISVHKFRFLGKLTNWPKVRFLSGKLKF